MSEQDPDTRSDPAEGDDTIDEPDQDSSTVSAQGDQARDDAATSDS